MRYLKNYLELNKFQLVLMDILHKKTVYRNEISFNVIRVFEPGIIHIVNEFIKDVQSSPKKIIINQKTEHSIKRFIMFYDNKNSNEKKEKVLSFFEKPKDNLKVISQILNTNNKTHLPRANVEQIFKVFNMSKETTDFMSELYSMRNKYAHSFNEHSVEEGTSLMFLFINKIKFLFEEFFCKIKNLYMLMFRDEIMHSFNI